MSNHRIVSDNGRHVRLSVDWKANTMTICCSVRGTLLRRVSIERNCPACRELIEDLMPDAAEQFPIWGDPTK